MITQNEIDMAKNNMERLQEIAEAMQDLNERIVYVGGVVTGLYATDPEATKPRTTTDVDCVVNTTSYSEHIAFEELLRAKGFQNDKTHDAPICRWIFKGGKVDVLPMGDTALLFGNPWYQLGFNKREPHTLPSGITIYCLSVTYFIASKIIALLTRGGNDWRGSKDFEDIVYVLNYCTDLIDKYKTENTEVQSFVSMHFATMPKRNNIKEEIECAISPDKLESIGKVLKTMKRIAECRI